MSNEPPAIAPCLWFDDQAQAAARLYCDALPDSRVIGTSYYPTGFDNPGGRPRGSVMTVDMSLAGTRFTALNGGPVFAINPTVSFFVHTRGGEETRRIVAALAGGGSFLMELSTYPWSPLYAWVQDRFGVSWQVMQADEWRGPTIVPCLMFTDAVHGRAEEALRAYAALFPGGRIEAIERYAAGEGPTNTVKHGRASLGGQQLAAMDSHVTHGMAFNEGVSLQVLCRDQAEVDHFWFGLSDGGQEQPCGWLKDRFGVSWQVVPTAFADMMARGEAAGPGYERAFRAMLGMTRLDIGALEAAYEDRT